MIMGSMNLVPLAMTCQSLIILFLVIEEYIYISSCSYQSLEFWVPLMLQLYPVGCARNLSLGSCLYLSFFLIGLLIGHSFW
jgi:hypothetical protein